jgi:hypothetical protein
MRRPPLLSQVRGHTAIAPVPVAHRPRPANPSLERPAGPSLADRRDTIPVPLRLTAYAGFVACAGGPAFMVRIRRPPPHGRDDRG